MALAPAPALERCLERGGVAVFPSDTVYGLGCDPSDERAVRRLYGFKGRDLDKPSAVMFFSLELALSALPELGPGVRAVLSALLPGPVGVLLENPAERFPLACGADPATIGLRVPRVPLLAGMSRPLLQSSANLAGGPDPRRLEEVPEALRTGAELCIDGGELPGTPSTMVDLRSYDSGGGWRIVRAGAVSEARLRAVLGDPGPAAGADPGGA